MTVRDSAAPAGSLAANVVHFARLLRRAGLPTGPGRALDAVRTLAVLGPADRRDFYWALHAVFVSRFEEREIFDQAFRLFWRIPPPLTEPGPAPRAGGREREPRVARRLAEAWLRGRPAPPPSDSRAEADAGHSERERLRRRDFAQMSAEELRRARHWIARLRLPARDRPTRRFAPDARGARIDGRATLRASLRSAGADIPLRRCAPVWRPPPLVALCDISGSMSRYSRVLLHFLFALARDRPQVHGFLFGTRLSCVTRALGRRDPDVAVAQLSEQVRDWSGGTRIGPCLKEFNLRWSRRVLGRGAVVLLVTDGLDREGGEGIARQAERLRRSCSRLVWLNPLLRFQGFEPRAAGVRALLPHVDELRPVHDLTSLEGLVRALGSPRGGALPASARP